MRGRKPKPPALVALEGYRGKRRPPASKLAGVPGIPAAPAWLSARARALWADAIEWLGVDLGTLTRGDQTVLALYCETAAEFEAVTRRLRKLGRLQKVHSPSGDLVYRNNPLVEQQAELRRQLRLLCGEMGLTPVARARVPQTAEDDGPKPETIGGFLGRSS